MKFIALSIFLVGITFQCYSQAYNSEENGEKLRYLKKIEKYRKMRNTGKFLTVTGGILFIGGIVTIVQASHDYNTTTVPAVRQSASNKIDRGFTAFTISFGALGAGIPLWIVGGHSREKYERKLRNLSVSIKGNNLGTGLAVAYHF